MKDHGLDPVLVPGGLTERAGEESCDAVLAVPGATAVAAFNDHCAAGLLAAARARGVRVPDDLSVCGYDDSRVASLATVSLTTVAQDAPALAAAALDLAITRAGDPGTAPTEVVVAPRLVVRGTTGRPVPH
jgi:DNA-binding LacI/PurR family transcriptional regulator